MPKVGSDCPTGKEQYTKEGAREERDRCKARGDPTMKAYHCPMCGCHHVGHRRRADRKQAVKW